MSAYQADDLDAYALIVMISIHQELLSWPISQGMAQMHSLRKRIFKNRTKRKPKTNKAEHEMEEKKSNRSQSQSKSESQP
ncbi:hypothetical protein Tco_0927988 [Tanacetum coccineum]